jgi:type III pantothenate kinase
MDFGTALTFTSVNADGLIIGVAIAPGIKTAMKALAGNTSKLPEVPLVLPDSVLGRDTVHAIQAGILWGYVGLVEFQLKKIKEEIGEAKVLATGGLSFVLKPIHNSIDFLDTNLTMNGMKVICEQVLSRGKAD